MKIIKPSSKLSLTSKLQVVHCQRYNPAPAPALSLCCTACQAQQLLTLSHPGHLIGLQQHASHSGIAGLQLSLSGLRLSKKGLADSSSHTIRVTVTVHFLRDRRKVTDKSQPFPQHSSMAKARHAGPFEIGNLFFQWEGLGNYPQPVTSAYVELWLLLPLNSVVSQYFFLYQT